MDEIVDHELAKKFSDKGGHDAVIEILLWRTIPKPAQLKFDSKILKLALIFWCSYS